MVASIRFRAMLLSALIVLVLLGIWHVATQTTATQASAAMTPEQVEYMKMLGKDPGAQKSAGFPTPLAMGQAVFKHLSDPF